jgi:hypothetical protein
MKLTSATRGARPIGWLVAVMLGSGVVFVGLRLVTPGDGTQVPLVTWAWTRAGVAVQAPPGGMLGDGDLVTAIDGVALGGSQPGWRAPTYRPGDRLAYQLFRGGRPRTVPVTLRRVKVADRLLRAWGTVLFMVTLFVMVTYLYARRPGAATGALLVLGSGLLSSNLAYEIGVSAVDARGGPVLWLYLFNTQVVYVMGWVGAAAFVLLFPSPWPPLTRSRRLLPAIYAAPVGVLAACSLVALAGADGTQWAGRVVAVGTVISLALLGTTVVLGIVRYRHTTDPIGRQQLKWLAGGGVISASLALALWLLPELVLGRDLLPAQWIGFVGLPLLAGLTVAVLRYRLFDVDRIISRTLAYGLLTLLLGGGYAAVALGLGQLLGRDSSLVVATATLTVAALFQPARRRVQQLVDRRFNRRHHDTAQTIAAFSARLREQVDLDTLSAELLAVADRTMEPTMVSLWLRPPIKRSGQPAP